MYLINPGEEVIIPTPYWVNYKHMTEILNGVPVFVAADEEHDFIVTADAVRAAITDKTRVIYSLIHLIIRRERFMIMTPF